MERRRLVQCGLVAAAIGAAGIVLGGSGRPGYDPIEQTVSELLARGAPARARLTMLFFVYNSLLLAFAAGLRGLARERGAAGRRGLMGANRLLALGLLGMLLLALPMDPGGQAHHTAVGMAHLLVAGGMAATATSGVYLCGLWLRREGGLGRLGRLSPASAATMAVLAVLIVAAIYTETAAGLVERLLIGTYILWMGVVLAVISRSIARSPAVCYPVRPGWS